MAKLAILAAILDRPLLEIVLVILKAINFHLLNMTFHNMIYQRKWKNKRISFKIWRKSMYKKLLSNQAYQDFLIMNKNQRMIEELQYNKIEHNKLKWRSNKIEFVKWSWRPISNKLSKWKKTISELHKDSKEIEKVLHQLANILWKWVGKERAIMSNFQINDYYFIIYNNDSVYFIYIDIQNNQKYLF